MKLEELQRLSGIGQGVYPTNGSTMPALQGSNISITGNEKGKLMKRHNIRPGTPEWFQLWFSLPFMTGEKPVK
jgi:hypothetical protein